MNEVNDGASSQSSSQSPLSLAETGEHTYTEVCYGAEGSIQSINGRDYRTYCYNSKWNGFVGMGYLPTLEECESKYNGYTTSATYGFHWYPGSGACYLFVDKSAQLYVYHYGTNEKIFAIPTSLPAETPLCPLATKEGEVWKINGKLYRLYCRGQAKVDAANIKQLGKASSNITECEEFSRKENGELFHWYQSYQAEAAGDSTGKRNCEVVTSWPGPKRLVPLRTKNSYMAAVPYSGKEEDVEIAGEIDD
ncbi:hypothetical protein V499_03391 [Pseudogymnoascus sp. VKM F-103]|nr:hypothetical protein V499_03391 [Pseudogymnoascus sp. VKM F-103]